jgi:hypothetical protein
MVVRSFVFLDRLYEQKWRDINLSYDEICYKKLSKFSILTHNLFGKVPLGSVYDEIFEQN